MAINKVVYGADTLVDLTEDTVTAEDVLNSKSFHTPDGVQRTGTASYPVTDVQVNGTSVMDGKVSKVEQPTADKKTATDQFNTVDGGLLSKCMIDLVPVQSGSGDPYPAGGGKNKCDNTQTPINAYVNGSGVIVASDNDRGLICKVSPNTQYTISYYRVRVATGSDDWMVGEYTSMPSIGDSGVRSVHINVSAEGLQKATITTQSTTEYLFIKIANVNTTNFSESVATLQVELGSTATDYVPYSNVRPISGHTEVELLRDGRNFLPITVDGIKTINGGTWTGNTRTIKGVTTTILTDSNNNVTGIKLNGTSSEQFVLQYTSSIANNYVGKKFNGYDGNTNAKSYAQIITYSRENGSWITEDYQYNGTDQTIKNYTKLSFGFLVRSGKTLNDVIVHPMLRKSDDKDSTFEPYQGELYVIDLEGTRYGGYVDLVSGVMIATHASETITSMEYYGTYGVDNAPLFYKDLTNTYVQYGSATAPIANKPISNAYRAISVNDATQLKNNEFRTQQVDTPNRYYFRDDRYNSKAQMDAWLSDNPVQVCGKLATPLTINLTPQQIETLAGQNNLSTPLSGQSIETNGVEYKELFTFADVKEYVKPLIPYSNAGSHNAIYRGKYLGDHVTLEQWASIVAGTFDDLFIGDYWTINGVNWRIAHFDYWYRVGDTECTDHHVVIVPDTNLYNAKMNSTDITTGGYYNSEMRGGANYLVSGLSNLYSASETIKSAFGSSHILSHREILTNTVTSGNASGWAWYNSSVELMSEVMVYGTLAWSNGGKGYEVGDGKGQLALFRHDILKATNRAHWWLRGVYSAAAFVLVTSDGAANNAGASYSFGVRPCFAIK